MEENGEKLKLILQHPLISVTDDEVLVHNI